MRGPEEIALHLLVEGPKVRVGDVDVDHAQAMVAHVDDLPPIEVVKGRGDTFVILSGAHRVKAHLLAHRDTIQARVLDIPKAEWFAYALAANGDHGKAYTAADRRAHVVRFLKEDADQSDRLIAERAGVSPSTVGTVRRDLGLKPAGVQTGHLKGRGGKTFGVEDPEAAAEREAKIRELCDDGLKDQDIATQLGCSVMKVVAARKRYAAELQDSPPDLPPAGERTGGTPSPAPPGASSPAVDETAGDNGEGVNREAVRGPVEPESVAGEVGAVVAADLSEIEADAVSDASVSAEGVDGDGHALASTPSPDDELRAKASTAVAAAHALLAVPAADAAAVLRIEDMDDRWEFCADLLSWCAIHQEAIEEARKPKGVAS